MKKGDKFVITNGDGTELGGACNGKIVTAVEIRSDRILFESKDIINANSGLFYAKFDCIRIVTPLEDLL